MTCEKCGGTVAALESWVVDGVAVWICEACAAPLIVADGAGRSGDWFEDEWGQ